MRPAWRGGRHYHKAEYLCIDKGSVCVSCTSILAEQRQRKENLSVILYLDTKNAFNAVNHRAIFYILEAKGFPPEDIVLFRRMYIGSFLVMANWFGRSTACMLKRGVAQGAQPNPRIFSTTFDPVHAVIRESRRGCTLQENIDPTGSMDPADMFGYLIISGHIRTNQIYPIVKDNFHG